MDLESIFLIWLFYEYITNAAYTDPKFLATPIKDSN